MSDAARAYMPPVAATVEWETPWDFFAKYDAEFGFTIDVCATPDKAKCPRFYTPEQDGLSQDWSGEVCWMNPPYGPAIPAWMKKAYESSLNGATVVCLVPSRTDTRWWHDYAEKGERRFVKGRLKFGGSKNSAPFPSAVVIFRGSPKEEVSNG
jgi:phage N-6-adenine-methyltransferase